MSKPNFFADQDVLNFLLGMQYDENAKPEMDLTVNFLDMPFWFSLKNEKQSRSLTVYKQTESYSKDEKLAVFAASVVLDDVSGQTQVKAPQGLRENMASFYLACRNLSLFARKNGLEQLWGSSDPEQSGILLSVKGGMLRWRLLSGANRPELSVEQMHSGTIQMSQPMNEPEDRPETDVMSLEEKIAKAEGGDRLAMAQLAQAYLNGNDEVEQDAAKAAYWYWKETELQDSEGAFNLGLLYAKGLGVKRDFERAAAWMAQAVSWGNPDGAGPAKQYYALAESQKKAEAGDAKAMAELAAGFMALGETLDQAGAGEDYKLCLRWAQKAVDAGCADGYWPLALAYEHGRGVQKDDRKAVEYYRKGAELGNAACQHSYGCRLIKGEGVKKNAAQARRLFEQSADQGYDLAREALDHMNETGEGAEPDEKNELESFEKACEAEPNNAELMRNVGFQFTNLMNDPAKWPYAVERAAYWLRKAADLGDETAAKGADLYEEILELYKEGKIKAGTSLSGCMVIMSSQPEKKDRPQKKVQTWENRDREAEAKLQQEDERQKAEEKRRQEEERRKAEEKRRQEEERRKAEEKRRQDEERRRAEEKRRQEGQQNAVRAGEKTMLAKVDAALAKARKAGAEYEVDAMMIERRVSRTTININSPSSLNELRSIVRECASACDKLYLAYQNLIQELDSELRACLAHNPGAYAVRAVVGTISWLNEESKIQNNYAAQFDGIDLGQIVRKEYLPRPESLAVERYWKTQYSAIPNKGDAESRWNEKLREHKRLASQEESNARDNRRKAEQETRDLIKNFKQEEKEKVDRENEARKREFQAQYSAIRERMEYGRPARDLLFFRAFNYGYVTMDGAAHINYDENHVGCVVRRMHDLKQLVVLSVGVVGLDKNGRCQLSNIDADSQRKYGLSACARWRNVRKIAACNASNQVIGLLEDGHCVATTPDYDAGVHRVSSWSNIVDIVCEQYYAAGLRNDGTVVISGEGNIADNLRKIYSGQKDILAIFPYSTWHVAALKADGTILPDIAEMKEPAMAAKNIVAIARNTHGPVFLQADGTVVATKDCIGGWGGQKTEGYPVKPLKKVVALYTGEHDVAALCEDGMFQVYDQYRDSIYALNKGEPLFRSYREYYNEIKRKEQAEQEHLEKLRREEQLRADRRAKDLCQYCGGKLEKKLLGWKCVDCGKHKDY